MIAISEKISDPGVNMPYLRFLLFILILGPVLQPAYGQDLPGFTTTPPASILGPPLKPRRPRVPEIVNEPSNVTNLTFDKEVVYSSRAGKTAAECADDEAKIMVLTVAEDKENDILTYQYTVSAGRIIGQGASIIWDLSGTPAGLYSLTVGSDDGCGVCGRTMTKEIEVKAAPDVENITLSKKQDQFAMSLAERGSRIVMLQTANDRRCNDDREKYSRRPDLLLHRDRRKDRW